MATNDEIIAVSGVKAPAPWVLLESSTFSGRFYFFNTTTLESKWSLPEALFNDHATPTSSGDTESDKVTDSLFAAQEAVRRMEARYGASPSRSEDETTENELSNLGSKTGSTAFSKRARDLDPRLMSIDLEEQLTSALNKADIIEKRWTSLIIPEEETQTSTTSSSSSKNNSKSSSKIRSKTPTNKVNKSQKPVPKSPLIPSAESFHAMNSFGGDETNNNGDGSGGGGIEINLDNQDEDDTSSSECYVVISGLGSGGYSNVLLVKNIDKINKKGNLMAMKVLSKKMLKRPRDRARLRNELRALTEIPPSRFTQRCFSAFESPSHVCFVTEYLCGGDMFFHLTSRVEEDGEASGFPESEARILLAEIVLGLIHMHKHNFIHCDIKVENIMLDAQGHVKLIDFGLSQEIVEEEEPMSPIGSLIYMAPELLVKGTGGRHTDWWALGVLAHEMMTGRSPWSSLTDKKLIKKQIKSMKIQPPDILSKGASDFICNLLTQDMNHRLGTKNSNYVKNASFFHNKIDWDKQENGLAPSAFKPPEIAFIKSECDNALSMYKGSDCTDANWELGVEEVKTLPPVLKKDGSVSMVGSKKIKNKDNRSSSTSSSNSGTSSPRKGKDPSPTHAGSHTSTSPRGSSSSNNNSNSNSGSGISPKGGVPAFSNVPTSNIKKGSTQKAPKPKTPRVPLEPNRPRLQKGLSKSSASSSTWR
mmetsp:Transcript_49411/g.63391  ORF Transcript_49411/g.63391 Transcript_49411/m.63391 type:complete len:703 (+) Transcript_49411:99-2207(+)